VPRRTARLPARAQGGAAPARELAAPAAAAAPAAPAPPPPPPDTVTVTVDGKSVVVPKGINVLQARPGRALRGAARPPARLPGACAQARARVRCVSDPSACAHTRARVRSLSPAAPQACEAAGVDVPRFCYHSRLSIAGNCRMCLVEVVKSPKPVASCAMPVMPNMEIKTTTPLVKKAREGVMEFLLINHPLDCPICDQGGECDLQDQAFVYGSDRSRFVEGKRSVEDKNLGPLVKTVMTRCIHCTRCVRFAKEIAGVEDLGVTGRGNASEVGTYVSKLMTSELSGNVIDICPVGALTSKPYAFSARQWELKNTESVDVLDALGSAIRVDSRGTEVMRVLPRLHEGVNEEWLSDKARFAYDGLKRQRLAQPLLKAAPGATLAPATWEAALDAAAAALRSVPPAQVKAIVGKLADAESIVALKDLCARLGVTNLGIEGVPAGLDADVRSSYLFNARIERVEDADLILLVGSNPRIEAPVLNARLRRAAIAGAVPVAVLGPAADLTYPTEHLGDAAATIGELASGAHPFAAKLKAAKKPLLLVGGELLRRGDRDALLAQLHALADATGVVDGAAGWNGFCVLHDAGGRVAALDLGFVAGPSDAPPPPPRVVFLLGADDFSASDVPPGATVVFLGSHGDAGAARADVVLPGAAYTEKAGTYVNTEGRAQLAHAAVSPPGNGREDWKVLRALSEVVGAPLPYASLSGVRARLAAIAPHMGRPDEVQPAVWLNGAAYAHKAAAAAAAAPAAKGKGGAAAAPPLKSFVDNFYMTDAITRASAVMARATAARKANAP
jgi:NADH dehydrogenase (ubiquinone) Fe-S protein 1